MKKKEVEFLMSKIHRWFIYLLLLPFCFGSLTRWKIGFDSSFCDNFFCFSHWVIFSVGLEEAGEAQKVEGL